MAGAVGIGDAKSAVIVIFGLESARLAEAGKPQPCSFRADAAGTVSQGLYLMSLLVGRIGSPVPGPTPPPGPVDAFPHQLLVRSSVPL